MGRPGVRVESRGSFCHADRSQESTFGAAGAVPTIPTIPTIPEDLSTMRSFLSPSTFAVDTRVRANVRSSVERAVGKFVLDKPENARMLAGRELKGTDERATSATLAISRYLSHSAQRDGRERGGKPWPRGAARRESRDREISIAAGQSKSSI